MPEPIRAFETERTRRFRGFELSEEDERTIANIEKYGCQVVHVKCNEAASGWSYTLGVYDTSGNPEILTVGLLEKTAHYLLNEAAHRLRAGVNLAEGRHRDMLGDVECEFRPVAPKWIKPLMGWAWWFYEAGEFPVLQAVYPDLKNRLPGEPDFDPAFQQPLLQPDAPFTRMESDFWASADPGSSLFDWKFPGPARHGCLFVEGRSRRRRAYYLRFARRRRRSMAIPGRQHGWRRNGCALVLSPSGGQRSQPKRAGRPATRLVGGTRGARITLD